MRFIKTNVFWGFEPELFEKKNKTEFKIKKESEKEQKKL